MTRSEVNVMRRYVDNVSAIGAWGNLVGSLYGFKRAYDNRNTKYWPGEQTINDIFDRSKNDAVKTAQGNDLRAEQMRQAFESYKEKFGEYPKGYTPPPPPAEPPVPPSSSSSSSSTTFTSNVSKAPPKVDNPLPTSEKKILGFDVRLGPGDGKSPPVQKVTVDEEFAKRHNIPPGAKGISIRPVAMIQTGLRYVLWVYLYSYLFNIGFTTIGLSIYRGKQESDPRLEDFRKSRIPNFTNTKRAQEAAERARRMSERVQARLPQNQRQQQQESAQSGTPSYPPSRPSPDDDQSLGGLSTSDSIFIPDDMQEFQQQQSASASSSNYPSTSSPNSNPGYPSPRASPRAQPKAEDDSSQTFGFESDDRPGSGAVPNSDSSAGSAWDKIRAQAKGGTGESWARRRAGVDSTASSNDSFAYSNADSDKQLAQEEAQKEFDRKLERERRGEDGFK